MDRFLVTSALPYANGPLHLGHLAGAYLPADIFVRAMRLAGHEVLYVCGTDEHGVPITITAANEGVSPRDVVNRYHKEIAEAFDALHIDFDNFSGTAREPHAKLSQEMFLKLLKNNYVTMKEEEQYFDEKEKKFLPDRYVEGTCPKCADDKARGDQCDKCGALLTPFELVDARSALSGEKPSIRKVKHWYLKLQDFEKKLVDWLESKKDWKDNVTKFILGWIRTDGLHERAITRSIDWGIPVPLDDPDAKNKVLYVWFDAPIGYISSTIEWAERIGKPDEWKKYWQDKKTKMVHFIGKDNIPFHAVIWPAILMGQAKNDKDNPWILPYDIPANEYLNLEGEKISTSRNWAVWAKDAAADFPSDTLRYALAANAPESKDADFAWSFFQARNNDELANIIGNFCNRVLTFVHKEGGIVPEAAYTERDRDHFKALDAKLEQLFNSFSQYRVREACKLMMDLGREGNRYFDELKPWELRKTDLSRLSTVLNVCLETLRIIAFGMFPILPSGAQKLWKMLGQSEKLEDQRLVDIMNRKLKQGQKLGVTEILYRKIEDSEILAQKEKLYKKAGKNMEEKNMSNTEQAISGSKPQITIDDFAKIDLRVAEIIEASALENSKKLIKLQVQVGAEKRQILAGIKGYVDLETLPGRKVVIVYNLKPAKLAGEESQGMLLAASDPEHTKVYPIDPGDLPSGSMVK